MPIASRTLWTQTIREFVGLYRVICGPLKVMCGTVMPINL